jgi:hypothetical protein
MNEPVKKKKPYRPPAIRLVGNLKGNKMLTQPTTALGFLYLLIDGFLVGAGWTIGAWLVSRVLK